MVLATIARHWRKWRSEIAFARGSLEPPVGPRYAQIEPTVRCNLRCVMCPRTLDPDAYRSADMKRDEFRRVLDRLPALEQLQLSGFGEPFAHRDLPELMADAAARGIKVSVNTNSTLWTPELAGRTIASGVDRIKLSLDSADPEEFQRIRGVDLDTIGEKIRLVTEAKRRAGGQAPTLSLNVVVQAANLGSLDCFFQLAEQLGVDRLRFKSVLGFRVAALDAHKTEGKNEAAVREMLARGRSAAGKSPVENNFARLARRLERQLDEAGGTSEDSYVAEETVPRCLYVWLATFISNRGVVRPCCKFYRDGMLDLGNILDESMQSIWRGEGYCNARKTFLSNRPVHAVCLDCDQHGRSRRLLERTRRRYGRLAR